MVHVTTFNERIRALMDERGVSLRKLAAETHYDVGHLSRVVNGHKSPSARLAQHVDDALGADGELVTLVRPGREAVTPDDEDRIVSALRRPAYLDHSVVHSLATILAAQRRTEDVIGSAPLIAPVRGELETITELVDEARGELRPALVTVAAQWAQFHGWLRANVGDLAEAASWYDRALEWASEVGDTNMTATALSMKGHLAWVAGNVGPVIGLSRAARRDTTVSAGVRALAAQQEARGHAIIGDSDATDRRLDEAHELTLAAVENSDDEPPWVYFFDPDFLSMQRARAYLYLPDRHATAIELLTTGLERLRAEVQGSEWVAFYRYDLACAYTQAGEHEEGHKIASEVAALADRIGSKRLLHKAAALT